VKLRISTGLLMAVIPLAAAVRQPVKTDLGAVSGVLSAVGAVAAFKGIPFAAPPVENNRWRPPKPAEPWQGVRHANEISASCIQNIAVPVYDGEGLASKGLVVVTVNYRLGALGFLSHPDLTEESDYHASGGDPGRVTIAGQSAGSRSVHCLSVSPLAKDLFHRAISESGSGVRRVTSNPLREAEQDGLNFAASKGAKSLCVCPR
jgi:carboxylesterase type B